LRQLQGLGFSCALSNPRLIQALNELTTAQKYYTLPTSAVLLSFVMVSFVPAGWTHTKQYALRPGYPAVWGGGCRESIDYKRAKAPPRLMNGSSTLLKRGGRAPA
jgi:hypothetical protein